MSGPGAHKRLKSALAIFDELMRLCPDESAVGDREKCCSTKVGINQAKFVDAADPTTAIVQSEQDSSTND